MVAGCMLIVHSPGYDNQNLFFDEKSDDKLSKVAHHFIAGVLNHAREFCLLTNPVVNSYKRLVARL